MGTTKQKILAKALELFNQQGLSKITLRRIAVELDMSQGNLNYHYKKREDIIEALYYQLVAKIDECMNSFNPTVINLNTLFDISKATTIHFYDYRFFFLDFTQIVKNHEKIRAHYNKLMLIRRTQTLSLFSVLEKQNIIRSEEINNEYDHLFTRIQILSDFWMASSSLKSNDITPEITSTYVKIISESIYPYLTKKGIKAYQKIA